MYATLCMPMFPVRVFGVSFCGSYCLTLLYFQLVGAPGAVNIHYFVWKLLSTIYKFSFIHLLKEGVLSSGWSLIRVFFHQGGLSSAWSVIRVVSH